MLKNILSLLLSRFYSKQESELVGHQAMPSTNNVILTPTTTVIDGWSSVFNGVAPTDGFACIRFTADTATCIASAQTTNINVFTTPQVVGDILLCACPVAKGQVFTLCARQAKNIECWFTKTIGGGYQTLKNALLQGGGLCLSHWYSSLQRNSYRTSGSGWLISQQFLFKALLNYLLLQMEKVTHSRCRTRGLSTSEVMEFGLPILEGSISSISDHLRMGIFRSGLTLKKVKNLPTQLGNQISSLLPIFEYTKSRGTIDQMFGGASC